MSAGLILAAIASVVCLAPAIVAHTRLKHQILSAALSDFEGTVTVGSLSLGWLSPIVARDVRAYDGQDRLLGTADMVRSDASLLSLLINRRRPGAVRVERPLVCLEIHAAGTNWQDAVAPLLDRPSGGSTVSRFELHGIDGRVEVLDTSSGQTLALDPCQLQLQFADDQPVPFQLQAAAVLNADGHVPSDLTVQLTWQPAVPDGPGGSVCRAVIGAESFPLACLTTISRRLGLEAQLAGSADCQAQYQWNAESDRHQLSIDRLTASDVMLHAPRWLGTDRLQIAGLNAAGQLAAAAGQWQVHSFEMQSELGQLTVRGSTEADTASAASGSRDAAEVRAQSPRLECRVDLARLASMLPDTLNLRPGTQLESGVSTLSIAAATDSPAGWDATLEVIDLAAVDAGIRVQQRSPIRLTARFQALSQEPVISRLECQSAFLDAAFRGDGSAGSLVVQRGDLAEFVAEVGPFLGLRPGQLAGQVQGEVSWQSSAAPEVNLQGDFQLRDFAYVNRRGDRWAERSLKLDVSAVTELREGTLQCVRSAAATLSADQVRLAAALRSPVERPGRSSRWDVELRAEGPIDRWIARVPQATNWLASHPMRLGGQVNVQGDIRLAASGVETESVRLQIDQFQAQGPSGLAIGPGHIAATFQQDVLQCAPLQLPFCDGRLLGTPRVDMAGEPVCLYLPPGPALDQIRISPELCHHWLKYVAPLVADTTRAEGRFSIALDGAAIPLADLAMTSGQGQLIIHTAHVGPGPLARQFIGIANEVRGILNGRGPGASANSDDVWLTLPQQTVLVEMRDGRITHRQLVMQAGDVVISTSGTVGLDESLSLVAEIPVRDEWLAGQRYMDALRGTVIKLPVRGTLSQPRIDDQALRELSRTVIGNAAGRLLEQELNRGLQRLFGP
jgi:hypothetical protein